MAYENPKDLLEKTCNTDNEVKGLANPTKRARLSLSEFASKNTRKFPIDKDFKRTARIIW